MKIKWRIMLLAFLFLAVALPARAETVKGISSADVFFSPRGGCTQAVIDEIGKARSEIVVHAHSFPSYEISRALAAARERGVKVTLLLDKSQRRDKGTTAFVFEKAGILIYIDSEHHVANNNVMIIDRDTVITGSFGFTKEAEEKNAENLLIVRSRKLAELYLQNYDRHMAHSGMFKP
jgi:phosphatidylserine/phosphatidylglycerophosphate/cardiolipin synthase-like enzyme